MIWPRVPEAAMVPVASGLRVVVAQHRRQRDQAHGDDGGADDAGGGRQQRADEDDRDAEAAGNRAEQLRHRHQQVLGDLRALQHDAHEHEQRNGDQRVALDLPVDAAEVGDAGGQPLDGTALGEIGAGVAGEQLAAQRGRGDGEDGRTRQREGHRKARGQCRHHQGDQQERERRVPWSVPLPSRPQCAAWLEAIARLPGSPPGISDRRSRK